MPYKQGSAIEWSSDQIKGDKQTSAKLGTKSRFSRLQPLKAILGQSQAIAKPKLLRQLGSASIRLGLSGLRLSSHAVATLSQALSSSIKEHQGASSIFNQKNEFSWCRPPWVISILLKMPKPSQGNTNLYQSLVFSKYINPLKFNMLFLTSLFITFTVVSMSNFHIGLIMKDIILGDLINVTYWSIWPLQHQTHQTWNYWSYIIIRLFHVFRNSHTIINIFTFSFNPSYRYTSSGSLDVFLVCNHWCICCILFLIDNLPFGFHFYW